MYNAVCVIHENKNRIKGTIKFTKTKKSVKIEYFIKGLKDGKHGFHIHEYGDLTEGCVSSCEHFNPYNTNHGGLHSKKRHVGDLGNITSTNKISKGVIYDKLISLDMKSKSCIIKMYCYTRR